MRVLSVFHPALCCSTGVRGPEVDETLVRLAGIGGGEVGSDSADPTPLPTLPASAGLTDPGCC